MELRWYESQSGRLRRRHRLHGRRLESPDQCESDDSPKGYGLCFSAPKTKFQITHSAMAGKDKLSWQWSAGEAVAQRDVGTPLSSTTYSLCIYDGVTSKDKTGAFDGVTKAQLKTGLADKSKAKVMASGLNLVLPGAAGATYFDQAPSVIVELVSSTGTCWTSEFAVADTTTNVATSFKAITK